MAIETLLTEDEEIEEQEQFGIKPAHLEVTALSTGGPIILEATHDAAQ